MSYLLSNISIPCYVSSFPKGELQERVDWKRRACDEADPYENSPAPSPHYTYPPSPASYNIRPSVDRTEETLGLEKPTDVKNARRVFAAGLVGAALGIAAVVAAAALAHFSLYFLPIFGAAVVGAAIGIGTYKLAVRLYNCLSSKTVEQSNHLTPSRAPFHVIAPPYYLGQPLSPSTVPASPRSNISLSDSESESE